MGEGKSCKREVKSTSRYKVNRQRHVRRLDKAEDSVPLDWCHGLFIHLDWRDKSFILRSVAVAT